MHIRFTKILVVLVVAGAVVSGCGKKTKSSSHTTTTKAGSGVTSTTSNATTDKANANKIVITQSDMPEGWTKQPPTSTDPQFNKKLNDCLGLADPTTIDTVNVNGDNFADNNGNTVSSSVEFLKTPQLLTQDYTAEIDPKNATCIANAFSDTIKQVVGQLGLSNVTVSSSLGSIPGFTGKDGVFGQRVTSRISGGPSETSFVTDLLGVAKGRAACSLVFAYFGTTPTLAFEQSLLTKFQTNIDSASTS